MDLLRRFSAGELSPRMSGSVDLPEFHSGCRTLENFFVPLTGEADRRPGLEHIAEVADSDYAHRLVGYVKGTTRYVLEFGEQTMRVYKDGALVLDGASAYELATPWSASEVFDLVFLPRGQAIFHPDYDLRELTCDGDTSWTLTAFASQYGPFLAENETTTKTITPSGTTGTITLTATGHTPFVTGASGHTGALWRLRQQVSETAVSGAFSSATTSSTLTRQGSWDFRITGTWAGDLRLQRSYDAGSTWKDVRVHNRTVLDGTPIDDKGVEDDTNVVYRLNMVSYVGGTCRYQLNFRNAWQSGIVRITAVTNSTTATATVLNTLAEAAAAYRWSEGAWSPYRGYPACGTIHEGRIFAAASSYEPTAVWSGKTFKRRSDSRWMEDGVEDDDAWKRTIDVAGCDAVEWLASLWVLLAGSNGNVVKGIGASEYQPMTPANANFLAQAGMGSASLQPVMVGGTLVYAGRNAKRVYEMTYSDDARVYMPEDLTFFADHIARTGIKDWAFQQQPHPILWAITNDGYLIGLTRDRGKGTKAWHTHATDGTFESVAVIPSDTDDEVWFEISRDVNGATMRCVERMKTFGHWGTTQRDCVYVDGSYTWDGGAAVSITGIAVASGTNRVTVTASGMTDGWTVRLASVAGMTDVNGHVYTVASATATTFVLKTRDGSAYIDGSAFATYTSGGTVERVANSVSGLTHLAAESVSVLLDGQPATGTVTAAGVYTVGTGKDRYYFNTITLGRPYTSKLAPTRPAILTVHGTVQPHKKITYCRLRLYQSAGGRIGTSADDDIKIVYREAGDDANADVALVTKDVEMDVGGGWQEHGDVYVETSDPLPMTITALLYGLET